MVDSIAERLARARREKGLRLDFVAERARVDADRLQALEAGTNTLSTAATVRLARVLGVDVQHVDPTVLVGDPTVFFRQRGAPDMHTDDLAAAGDALRDASRYATVLSWLGHTPRVRAELGPCAVGSPPHEHGSALARDVRRLLGNASEPIEDVKRVLERDAGALVVRYSFRASAVRALTVKHAATEAVAVVLTTANGLVRRVDLAHELAHVLFDAPRAESDVWIDLEDAGAYDQSPVEQRARAFAAELLVPLAGLRARFGEPAPSTSLEGARQLVRDVRAYFRVTAPVAVNHLKDLGYVPAAFREALLDDDVRVDAPERLDESALHVALREAVDEGLVSRARALELLGLSVFDDLP